MTNENNPIDIDEPMPFGKYKDVPLRHILCDDPGYLRWAIANTDCIFDTLIEDALENEALRQELIHDSQFI